VVDLARLTRTLSRAQIVSVHESGARLNVWEGSIRSGKTIASLLRWLMYVADAPRGGELMMFGKTRDSVARNLFGPLMDPDIFGPIAKQVSYTSGAPTAQILGRTVHVFGANDAKAEPKVRGMTLAGAYGDELTVIPQTFFAQVLGRLSVKGAKLFGTTNPDNPAHWLRKDYLNRRHERGMNLATWHFTIDDNPHLDPDYVTSIKAEYVGLWYRRFILGEWVQAEGAIYDMWDERLHVVDELPAVLRWLSLGVDYGTRNPFSGLLLGLTADRRLVLAREYRHDPRTARRQLTDAEYSRELRAWLAGDRPEFVAVDPSAASFKVQLHADRVTGVVDADNSVEDGIRTVASLLALGRLVVHRSCRGWIDEVAGYAWDDEAAAKGIDKPIKVADHSLDAGRYAVATTRQLWQSHVPMTAYALAA
jgi:PBSX family phage terminase large subunit